MNGGWNVLYRTVLQKMCKTKPQEEYLAYEFWGEIDCTPLECCTKIYILLNNQPIRKSYFISDTG
jgi:hypothetical protein